MTILSINKLYKSFGGLSAVMNFSFHMGRDELVGLIGPNGAGKTTVFNLITGVYKPDQGQIIFEGRDLVGMTPYNICAQGIARTFQNIRLFNELSVLDNVKIACHKDVQYSVLGALMRTPAFLKGRRRLSKMRLST